MRIYRVVVRGQFSDLDDAIRAALLNNADEHHFLRSAFNSRCEVRHATEDVTQDEIGDTAVDRTAKWLAAQGIGYKKLRFTVTDMSTVWDDLDVIANRSGPDS